jgi:Holliday junction resolvase RusA-like endonuclease
MATRGRPLEGRVGVEATFCLARPRRPARSPDLDRILRALLDGLVAGRAIGDHAQVTDVCCRRRYVDGRPETIVEVHPREGGAA